MLAELRVAVQHNSQTEVGQPVLLGVEFRVHSCLACRSTSTLLVERHIVRKFMYDMIV